MKSIQAIIDESIALAVQQREENRVPSGKFSPSMLGRCFRAQIYKRRNEPTTNPPDERTLRVFTVGHIFHKWLQDLIPAQHEVEVNTEHFRGFADTVTEDEIIDYKTVHSRQFFHMDKKDYDIHKEKKTNILQLIFYVLQLGKKSGRLVFVDKDSLCVRERGFFPEKWKEELQKEMDILIKHWESASLPDAEPRAYAGKECKYCGWADKCKQDGGKIWIKNSEISPTN